MLFQVCKSLEDMLDRRLQLLKEILTSEETYLNELETLLMVIHTTIFKQIHRMLLLYSFLCSFVLIILFWSES